MRLCLQTVNFLRLKDINTVQTDIGQKAQKRNYSNIINSL